MTVSLPPLTVGPITRAQVEAFAAVSGDGNPLHVNPALAGKVGLDAVPVHGMLLVAFLHDAARHYRPKGTITGLATRFMAPVPVGERLEISGRVVKAAGRRDPLVMRLFVSIAGGALACIAEATLSPPAEGWPA
ncbi:MaoC family dehydratase [Labrys monachus]|uniref:Acyl dehydratase n=1 Tax=Labrys monachus TaxID=217067 RepID=A0ABU0FDX5_9HYPH|nr:MaoC family dehydratase [Labrys monachus]MDQ0392265.1 acyl dehydratase [Labrys monachus]